MPVMDIQNIYSKRPSGQSTNVSGHCQQKVTYRLCTLIIPTFFCVIAQWDFLCTLNRGEMKLFYCKHNPRCEGLQYSVEDRPQAEVFNRDEHLLSSPLVYVQNSRVNS